MKRLVPILSSLILLALTACEKKGQTNYELRGAEVQMAFNLRSTSSSGDPLYDFCQGGRVAYVTDLGHEDKVLVIPGNKLNTLKGNFKVEADAKKMWIGSENASAGLTKYTVPEVVTKTDPEATDLVQGMSFCSEPVFLSGEAPYEADLIPLTSAVVFEVMDSRGVWSGTRLSGVTMTASGGKILAGTVVADLSDASIDEVQNGSTTLNIDCDGDFWVGSSERSTALGAVLVPTRFTGTITVSGPLFQEARFTVSSPLVFEAGYVKHVQLDLAEAFVTGQPSLPKRLGIFGDSISTFSGIIPSDHRAYYPAGDVDAWTKTYWGLLSSSKYWNCAIDKNTSWSGSSVADGNAGSVRTPFVDPARYNLFTNPDVIILFGGTNDAITSNGIGLGEFNYDGQLDQMVTTKRFRDAYIFLIRKLKQLHPDVRIICIIGTDIFDEYGNSVEAIAKHYCLPYVDFRGDSKVTIYSGSHPNANGHAYKAQKIYEQTQHLFQ